MKTYKITVTEEPKNFGHRMLIHGLRDLYPGGSEPNPEGHVWLISRYDYDKTLPPYWTAGICGQLCFTLPFAVYLELYDLCQVHEDLCKGDELVLEYQGKTYVTIVNTWPECPAASEGEKAFRLAYHIVERAA